jgi:hypothetical protein
MHQSGCTIWKAYVPTGSSKTNKLSATIQRAMVKTKEDRIHAIVTARDIDINEAKTIRCNAQSGKATEMDCNALEKFNIRQQYGIPHDVILDVEFITKYENLYTRQQYRCLQSALHGGTNAAKRKVLDKSIAADGDGRTLATPTPIVSSFETIASHHHIDPSECAMEFVEYLITPVVILQNTDQLLHAMGFASLNNTLFNNQIVEKKELIHQVETDRSQWLQHLNECTEWQQWCNVRLHVFNVDTSSADALVNQLHQCTRTYLKQHFNIEMKTERYEKQGQKYSKFRLDFSFWDGIETKKKNQNVTRM